MSEMTKITGVSELTFKNPRIADRGLLRGTFGRFASGVTVITSKVGEDIHGMTANSFVSVSLEPALALISVKKSTRMHEILEEADSYALSVLAAGQANVSAHFAGATDSGFLPVFEDHEEMPVIADAIAWMVCRKIKQVEIGDHSLFIGELVDCDHVQDADPLIFFGGNYGKLIP